MGQKRAESEKERMAAWSARAWGAVLPCGPPGPQTCLPAPQLSGFQEVGGALWLHLVPVEGPPCHLLDTDLCSPPSVLLSWSKGPRVPATFTHSLTHLSECPWAEVGDIEGMLLEQWVWPTIGHAHGGAARPCREGQGQNRVPPSPHLCRAWPQSNLVPDDPLTWGPGHPAASPP